MDDLLKSLLESNVFVQGYEDEMVVLVDNLNTMGSELLSRALKIVDKWWLTIYRARSQICLTLSGFETANPRAWDETTPIRLNFKNVLTWTIKKLTEPFL